MMAWQSAAIAGVASLLTLAATKTSAYIDFNYWTYDFTVLHAGLNSQSSDIVLVDFDEDTFQSIGKYPIPRSEIARAVSIIGAAKPRVIGMDVFLGETRTPEEDKAMQDALTSAGNVILASQTLSGGLPPVTPLPFFCQAEDPLAASGFCKDGTPGAMGYAFVNMPIDADGFIRRDNLFFAGPPPAASFAVTLAQQYTGRAIRSVDARRASFLDHSVYYDDPESKTVRIGAWAHEPVPRISARALLDHKVPASKLQDKLVLIGQSNDAARDIWFTPLFRAANQDGVRLRMSGTEIQGAAIRSLLEGSVIHPSPNWEDYLLVGSLSWAAAYFLLSRRTAIGMAWVLGLAAFPAALSLALYAGLRFWQPFFPAQTSIATTLPLVFGLQFALERLASREAAAQRQQLMALFSSYVDPAVANTIWLRRGELSLGGEVRVATVVFTDIRGFTSLSAGKPPSEVLGWLNQYMTAMDEVIREHGGLLNKFIGDGLMILFGLPLSQGQQADARRALRASLRMLERVEMLNRENAGDPAIPQLRIGIGVHTGSLMAGSIGSSNRQEYSVIGETVNLASRLESLNKQCATEILMSEATYELLRDEFTGFRPLGLKKIPGLEQPIPVYTIAAPKIAVQAAMESEKSEANANA
jgi:class 3 adenylate cyclase/CHASE2 domain-containing sensor protein